ncbi:MAG: TatD family hydrolase [Desulfobacterota bacterium]|nr:TatD family hydrolase [Thermodesulfobacteriota bacterium]
MYIDTHAHLSFPEFDKDRSEVIKRALAAGVNQIISIGTDIEDSKKALAIAEEFEFIYAAIGIHPHESKTMTEETYLQLRNLVAHNRVVALGEIGLDFYRNLSPPELQIRHFREQLQVARDFSLPVIIHDRNAHKEVMTILYEEKAETIGGVVHCFSGDKKMAKECLDMGFYISIPGTITYKKSEDYREMVRYLPLDQIFLETDCPFLAPQPFRGKRNEPTYLIYTAETVAQIKGIKKEKLAEVTTSNAQKLFNLQSKVLK